MAMNERQAREASVRSRVSRAIAAIAGASLALSAAASAATPPQEAEGAATAETTAPEPEKPASAGKVSSPLHPGEHVRVTATGSDLTEGRVVGVRDGRLLLDSVGIDEHVSKEIPIREVQTVWVRHRATKNGAIMGAALGGLGGAVLGGLFVSGMCDTDSCRNGWPLGVLAGLGIGGALGVFPGALIGAASPEWQRVYSADPAGEGTLHLSIAPVGAALPRTAWIGSASLHFGGSKALDALAPGGAIGWQLRLTSEGQTISPSLEVEQTGLGERDTPLTPLGKRLRYDESVLHFGPSVNVWLSRGRLRPYALAGLGYYRWKAFDPQVLDPRSGIEQPASFRDFLGGSIGGGVRARATRTLSFGLEGRWHTNVSAVPAYAIGEHPRRLSVLTLNAGATLNW